MTNAPSQTAFLPSTFASPLPSPLVPWLFVLPEPVFLPRPFVDVGHTRFLHAAEGTLRSALLWTIMDFI